MELKIRELDVDIISPNMQNMNDPDRGGSKIVIIGKPGTGKCLAPDTPVLLYDFSIKNVQDIVVGDCLRGDDEEPRVVQSIATGRGMLYDINQNEFGINYRVNGDHILCLRHFVSKEVSEFTVHDIMTQPSILGMYGGYRHNLQSQALVHDVTEAYNADTRQRLIRLRCPYTVHNNIAHVNSYCDEDLPEEYPITVTPYGVGDYYGFEIDQNGRFLLGDGTVTHNTTLITSLLYEKRGVFPSALIMSGTEDSNGHYKKIVPSTFVFNKLNEKKIEEFITRQKIAKRHLGNPWSVLLLDDCTDDPKIFNKPLFQGIFKNGRHWKSLFLISLQYCMDIKPVIRTNVDGVFILRETNIRNRKSLWENYAGIIPDFTMFCAILDAITDNYTALYIHNQVQSNKLEDCVFWYKAKPVPQNFRLGSKDFWKFHYTRYDPNYSDPFLV